MKKNIEPYANVVNQVVEDNGIEVKLTDVIIDKDELIFSTIVNTNKAVDGCSLDYDIFINGKKLKKIMVEVVPVERLMIPIHYFVKLIVSMSRELILKKM